jgi:hypothetical protein
MPRIRAGLLALAVGAALAMGACGRTSHPTQHARSGRGAGAGGSSGPAGPLTLPAPAPSGVAPPAAAVAVIRAWSDALRRGDVRTAARYFALPSVMINGTDASGRVTVVDIGSEADAVAANASLPCGATLAGSDQRGPYVNALFALGSRGGPGGDCRGQRGTARVNFVIHGGKIVHWLRAPDDPGDGASRRGGTPAQPPQGSGRGPSAGAPV